MTKHDTVNAPGRLADVAGRYTQYAGAAVSLSLMVGVAVWGTQTILRDVSGVPVVRAMQGDMRVAPKNPGGDVADHRGLAVNAVAAVGEAAPPEDTLMLAPKMLELAEEDLDTAPLAEATPDAATTVTEVTPETAPSGPMDADDILALADQISAGVAPMAALDDMPEDAAPTDDDEGPIMTLDDEVVTPAEVDALAADPIALALAEAMGSDIAAPDADTAPEASVASVIRPRARPLQATPAVATAADLAPAPVSVAAVTPAAEATDAGAPPLPSEAVLTDALPVGTKLVQLGAFPTPEAAAAEWDKLTGRFTDVMGGKEQVIQQASSGGATFYRLRASGFAELDDARRFCTTLDAGRAACIPVVVR